MENANDIDLALNRRKFIKMAAAAFTTSTVLLNCSSMQTKTAAASIGLQLYTVRDQIAKDITGTLKRVAAIGFHDVETGFWPAGMSVETAAKHLKQAGLRVFSAHCEIPVGNQRSEFLRVAEAFNCKRMVWHGWPEDERYKTEDGIKILAGLYNESASFARANGLEFGIHNHWWEFHNKIGERYAYEVLLDHLDKNVFFELDTYWLKSAGHDPAEIVKKFGGRAPLLHIKDGPAPYNDSLATDTTPMVPVGTGVQNFPAIVKASKGNTEWMIVEMDRTSIDIFEALQKSYSYLIDNKLAVAT